MVKRQLVTLVSSFSLSFPAFSYSDTAFYLHVDFCKEFERQTPKLDFGLTPFVVCLLLHLVSTPECLEEKCHKKKLLLGSRVSGSLFMVSCSSQLALFRKIP